MEWKHIDFMLKKKFWVQQSVKEVMLTVFLDRKGPITIDFPEKGATVNSASYCQIFQQYSPYLLNDPQISGEKNAISVVNICIHTLDNSCIM